VGNRFSLHDEILRLKDTHGKTSHLSAADLEALILYLRSPP
jgi:hypothetical protein